MNTKQMDDTITYMNTSFQDLKIAVAGTGYVGLSIATLLGTEVPNSEENRKII